MKNKILLAILILGVFLAPLTVHAKMYVDTAWLESETFQTIKDWYGKDIPYNDNVFDCEDFVAAYFAATSRTIKVPVGIFFKGGVGHVIAGMVKNDGRGVAVIEPQSGKVATAKTFRGAVKQFYPDRKFKIKLLNYDFFMNAVQEKTK